MEHRHNGEGKLSHRACVRIVPIFSKLSEQELSEVMKYVEHTEFERGALIFRAGEESNILRIIARGSIKLYRLSTSGKEQVVRVLKPGEFTGESALFNETMHETFGQALEETQVCHIHKRDLQEIMVKYPSISLNFLKAMSQRLDESEQQTTSFSTESTEQRLGTYLADLMGEDTSENIIKLPMSQKDIASYIGTTPETINRKLKEFEQIGYIRKISSKEFEIIDESSLVFLDS